MPKQLPPLIVRLKKWRAHNDLSQAEAAEILHRAGLPIRTRTLQAWEAGRTKPNAFAEVALTDYLNKHPVVSVKRNPNKPGPKGFHS
jgi:DNA-binding transcriptional regulator YiaG